MSFRFFYVLVTIGCMRFLVVWLAVVEPKFFKKLQRWRTKNVWHLFAVWFCIEKIFFIDIEFS